MSSLPDLNRLMKLSTGRQQACDRALANDRRALLPVGEDIEAINLQLSGLQEVLRNTRVEGNVHTQASLMSNLRQQASIRRRLSALVLEKAGVEHKREQLVQVLAERQQERSVLQRKHQKFELLQDRLLRDRRRERVRREELEIEDLLTTRP